MKRITMKDLAREAGVSIATVSLVLNNKADRLSPATIEHVKRLALELGFVSNLHAKSLKTNQSQTIGLLLPDIANPFFIRMAKSIEGYLFKYKYLLLISNTDGIALNEIEAIKRFRQLHVERVIVVASDVSTYKFVQDYALHNFVIFLDRITDQSHFWRVGSNDYQGGWLVAEEFMRYQHYDIICVTGPKSFVNVQERLSGLQEAYEKNGKKHDIFCMEGDFTEISGNALAEKIINHPYRAVFFMNDLMAMGFYRYCLETGRKVFPNYAIIGYDNIDLGAYLDPPLTSVDQPIEAMALRVIQMILHQTESQEKLPVSLVRRKSVFMANIREE